MCVIVLSSDLKFVTDLQARGRREREREVSHSSFQIEGELEIFLDFKFYYKKASRGKLES